MEDDQRTPKEMRYITEKLDMTPKLVFYGKEKNKKKIGFGNSGFSFYLDDCEDDCYRGTFDFMPENQLLRPNNTAEAARNARIFTCSIYALYQFLNNSEMQENLCGDSRKIVEIGAFSNRVFIDSVFAFFCKHGGAELVKRNREQHIYIDTLALGLLNKNNPFIKHIRAIAESENSKRAMVSRMVL